MMYMVRSKWKTSDTMLSQGYVKLLLRLWFSRQTHERKTRYMELQELLRNSIVKLIPSRKILQKHNTLFYLGNQMLLFSETRRKLYIINIIFCTSTDHNRLDSTSKLPSKRRSMCIVNMARR
ncbi:hypothetical protein MPTK2_1g90210P [Marchantia polymorpha subsp. ruderalis]